MKTCLTLSLLLLLQCLDPLGAHEGFSPVDHRHSNAVMKTYDELDNTPNRRGSECFTLFVVLHPQPATLLQVFLTSDEEYVLDVAVYDKTVHNGSAFAKDRKIIRTSKSLPKEIGDLLRSAATMELLHVRYPGLKQEHVEDGEYWLLGVQTDDSDYLCGMRDRALTDKINWVNACKSILEMHADPTSENTSQPLGMLQEILKKACDQWLLKNR